VRAGDRQQGYVSCPLDGLGDISLVLGAVTGNPAGDYLAAFSDEVAECAWILVVNGYLFVGAETAHLAPLKRSFLPWPARALCTSFVTH
jgi:hypothetical protein